MAARRRSRSLIEYLDERLGSHSGRGPEYQFACPACIDRRGSESSGRKLGINMKRGVGGCFRCGFAFRSLTTLFRYLNGGHLRIEELALLRSEVSLPTTNLANAVRDLMSPPDEVRHLGRRPLPKENVVLADCTADDLEHPRLRPAIEYLNSRGVTWDLVERAQLGFCPVGEYARRLIFPVLQHGEQVYFTSRYCGDHAMKAKNPPNVEGFHSRSTVLLGYDDCVGKERIALVEGPFDRWAYADALGLLGKHISDVQVGLIRALVPLGLQEVVVSLDAEAGEDAAKIWARLAERVPVCTVLPLADGDPWSRREALAGLLEGRRAPSLVDRLS